MVVGCKSRLSQSRRAMFDTNAIKMTRATVCAFPSCSLFTQPRPFSRLSLCTFYIYLYRKEEQGREEEMAQEPASPVSLLLSRLGMTRDDLSRHSDQMRQYLASEHTLPVPVPATPAVPTPTTTTTTTRGNKRARPDDDDANPQPGTSTSAHRPAPARDVRSLLIPLPLPTQI